MTVIEFEVDDTAWLSANDRRHWADVAKRTKALRQMGFLIARRDRVPSHGTAHVAAFIGYPRAGRADPANAAPTVKALIDGLVDAGVWPDDDSTHVIGPTYLRDTAKAAPHTHHVRLFITEHIPWLPKE